MTHMADISFKCFRIFRKVNFHKIPFIDLNDSMIQDNNDLCKCFLDWHSSFLGEASSMRCACLVFRLVILPFSYIVRMSCIKTESLSLEM